MKRSCNIFSCASSTAAVSDSKWAACLLFCVPRVKLM